MLDQFLLDNEEHISIRATVFQKKRDVWSDMSTV